MKTIAILTDFSEEAQNAITFAVELCRSLQGRLVFLHAFHFSQQPPGTSTSISGLTWADPSLYTPGDMLADQERERIMKDKLQEHVAKVRATTPDLEIQSELLRGIGMDTAVEYLKVQSVDMVVMGTKGADTAIDRWAGTNTSYIMNHATCPVLAIPRKCLYSGFSKLVYATDPHNEAEWHLQELKSLASLFRADVTVLYVQEDEESQASQDRWQVFTSKWEQLAPNFTYSRVFSDKLTASIEEFAQSKQADMLVIAKQDRSFLDNLFGSSPSDRLIFDNVMPVLSFPVLTEKNERQGRFFTRATQGEE